MTQVAEFVTFTLADGTTAEEFIKLSQASEAFVRAAPGFVHRHLSQGEDGCWTDCVVWQNMNAAQDAAAKFPQQEFAPALMAAIKSGSEKMRHENVLWNMTA